MTGLPNKVEKMMQVGRHAMVDMLVLLHPANHPKLMHTPSSTGFVLHA
jgi:hypothetical protein